MFSFAKKINELKFSYFASEFRLVVPAFLFILVCGIVAVSFSFFGKTEVDLRTLVPKDTIIYLESNDLGSTLNALTESRSFKEASKSKTDFSPIKGVQVAVAVSGFQTSENPVTDERSVLSFKPKFTIIAETHSWSWQVNSLVETHLNSFVLKTYGQDAKLEQKSVNDTERFTWTANDGRQTFAVISDSQVFFGNDEESINKCLSAKRGEVDSFLKNENLASEYDKSKGKLAFGFISKTGINQVADLVGVTVAVGQSEDENTRGFISRILPQILKNTTSEITWTAEKTESEIEDNIFIKTEKAVSNVLSETLKTDGKNIEELYEYLPFEHSSITIYNLKNPQISFRSLLLVTAKNTDPVNAKILSAFSNSLLGQYGIADAESFLNAVDSKLITAKVDDESVALVKAKDLEKVKATFIEGMKLDETETEKQNREIWKSEEGKFSVVFDKEILIMGESNGVLRCLESWNKRNISTVDDDFLRSPLVSKVIESKAVSATYVKDMETAGKIVKVLGVANDKNAASNSIIETRFTKHGIERKYISDFGFLGTIIEQFGSE